MPKRAPLWTIAVSVLAAVVLTLGLVSPAAAGPARPGKPKVDVSYRSAVLKVAAPAGTRLEVAWRKGSSGRFATRTVSGRKIVLKRLAEGAAYQVRVRARRGSQVSPWRRVVVRTKARYPDWFGRSAISLARGRDSITVSWPRRKHATRYRVAWVPNGMSEYLPTKPSGCRAYCKYVDTTSTRVTLDSSRLSLGSFFRASSSTAGVARFVVFAMNGYAHRRSNNGSFRAVSSTATVNSLPYPNTQMAAPLPPARGTEVKVASFNVMNSSKTPATGASSWAQRRPLVVDQIRGTGASIVGVQELSNGSINVPGGSSMHESLLSGLGQGWAQANPADSWADYNGAGVDDGRNNVSAAQGTRIFYRTSVWSLQERASMGVFMTGDTHLRNYSARDGGHRLRSVVWAKLRLNSDTDTVVCVLSAHLLSGTDRASSNRRNVEMGQIISMVNNPNSTFGRRCHGIPTVLTGDLNTTQGKRPHGSQPVVDLVSKAGFVDTKNAAVRVNAKYNSTGINGFRTGHSTYGNQVDYVLARGMGGARRFEVNHTPPAKEGSDHLPVTATIVVPPS